MKSSKKQKKKKKKGYFNYPALPHRGYLQTRGVGATMFVFHFEMVISVLVLKQCCECVVAVCDTVSFSLLLLKFVNMCIWFPANIFNQKMC